MADLLPSLSSDDENGNILDEEEDEQEEEEIDIEFGGILVRNCIEIYVCQCRDPL
jgi:hypothetical protein